MSNNKYSGFVDRLIELRQSKNFPTKTEFANWLGIARNSYSMIENGYRPPSKKILDQLLLKTGLPEEYWLYGVKTECEYSNAREEFKLCKKAIDDALDLNLIDLDGNATSKENEAVFKYLIYAALKADIPHILLKKKQGN